MSNLLTLQNSISFASTILKNQPLLVSNFEPALTAGNLVLGVMLGPPCKWSFNRASYSFVISQAGGTDYSVYLPSFGALETQWLTDATGNIFELQGKTSLAKDNNSSRPTALAVQYDDNAGNITFRLKQAPDQAYTVFIDYQKKMVPMTSPAQTWGGVSDHFAYIYNWGFLCLASLLVNDSRFPIFEQYFISRLLGAQDGLSEQERNIMVGAWMALVQTTARAQGAVNSGIAGRGK